MTLVERLASSFAREHPRDVAALVSSADAQDFGDFLTRLPDDDAALVITRSAPLAVAAVLKAMPAARASEVLEKLDARQTAAVLGPLDEPTRARFVAALPESSAEPVRRLLAYAPDRAGSRMDPRAPAVVESATVGEAIASVRRDPGSALYYVYVVGENYALSGVVNMRELLSADPDARIKDLMTGDPESVRAEASISSVLGHPGWLKVHALPVVDDHGRFLGAIRYSAFRKLEAEAGRVAQGPDPGRASGALAELFLLGAAAVARTAGSALLGSTAPHKGDS